MIFHDADFTYEKVHALNDILVETTTLGTYSLVCDYREYRAALPAASDCSDPFYDELRAAQKVIVIRDDFVTVLQELRELLNG